MPCGTRVRLTSGIYQGKGDDGLTRLDRAFELAVSAQHLRDRLHKARIHDIGQARQQGLINDVEAAQLRAAAEAVAAAVAVDDFAPEELAAQRLTGDVLSQAMSRPAAE